MLTVYKEVTAQLIVQPEEISYRSYKIVSLWPGYLYTIYTTVE